MKESDESSESKLGPLTVGFIPIIAVVALVWILGRHILGMLLPFVLLIIVVAGVTMLLSRKPRSKARPRR